MYTLKWKRYGDSFTNREYFDVKDLALYRKESIEEMGCVFCIIEEG